MYVQELARIKYSWKLSSCSPTYERIKSNINLLSTSILPSMWTMVTDLDHFKALLVWSHLLTCRRHLFFRKPSTQRGFTSYTTPPHSNRSMWYLCQKYPVMSMIVWRYFHPVLTINMYYADFMWNRLPSKVISATSLEDFKSKLADLHIKPPE